MTNPLFFSTPTPLTPPKLEKNRLSWLRLFRSRRVGVATFYRLLDEHGTAEAALDALPEVARAAGVQNYTACPEDDAYQEMQAARRADARLICRGDAEYPEMLAQIDDAPPLFWAVGDTDLLQQPMVALVGARNASSLGERMAKSLAGALGEAGLTVVSGLARGIDAAAHAGSLTSGTVAVVAGGVDIAYPKENKNLFRDIGTKGLRISEQAMSLNPQSRHFPPRNRIISGLSHGIIVVEAAARSGSLITARNALDQGREVMAVPGHPFDARASGCNILIRDGARLIRGIDDILEALGPLALPEHRIATNWREQAQHHSAAIAATDAARPRSNTPDPLAANGAHPPAPENRRPLSETALLHEQILSRLSAAPIAEDQLIRDLCLPAQDLSPVLLSLELQGHIARQPGGLISRCM